MLQPVQPPSVCGLPGYPDLLRHVDGPCLPFSPLYLSFFEEECRAIATGLRLGSNAASQPSPGSEWDSALCPDAAGPVTSKPLGALPSRDEAASDSFALADRTSTSGCKVPPRPAGGEPRSLLQSTAGTCPGTARPGSRRPCPQAPSLTAARTGAGQLPCSRPGPTGCLSSPACSLSRGSGRHSGSRARTSQGLELPKAGRGLSAPGTRLPQFPGTKLKLMPATKSRLQRPSRALTVTQPSTIPKPTPRETEMGSKPDRNFVCIGSSFTSESAPNATQGCEDAVPAEQSAGDLLSQELKRVKNELQQVKGELADKTVQCEVYCQMISSLQAQLRAAGVCPEDAAVEESGDLERD